MILHGTEKLESSLELFILRIDLHLRRTSAILVFGFCEIGADLGKNVFHLRTFLRVKLQSVEYQSPCKISETFSNADLQLHSDLPSVLEDRCP